MIGIKFLTVVLFMLPLFDIGVLFLFVLLLYNVPLKNISLIWRRLDIGVASCPKGWRPYSGHCYGFFDKAKTWFDARKSCLEFGSSLAVVNSHKENFWLKFQRVIYRQRFWIGGTDLYKDREWRWESTGKLSKILDFDSGQPNSSKQHCLELYSKKGQWNDYGCDNKLSFICER